MPSACHLTILNCFISCRWIHRIKHNQINTSSIRYCRIDDAHSKLGPQSAQILANLITKYPYTWYVSDGTRKLNHFTQFTFEPSRIIKSKNIKI